MKKLEYFIKEIHPIDFFDKKDYDIIKIIKQNFPELKIIVKGDRIITNGEDSLITQLRIRLDSLIYIMKDNDILNEKTINSIMSGNGDKLINSEASVILI